MTCGGCSGAIDRVLKKNIEARECRGVQWRKEGASADTPPPANGYTVSLETQKVIVFGPSLPPFDTITEKIAKTGKQIISKEEIAAGAPIPA